MFERVVQLGMAIALSVAVCSGALTLDQRAQPDQINPPAQISITGTIQNRSGAAVTGAEIVLKAAEGASTEIPVEVRLIRAVDSESPGFSGAEPGHIPLCPATSSLAREAN